MWSIQVFLNLYFLVAYDDFHAENPSGEIGLDKFLKISKVQLICHVTS